jgi:nucleotide-binding universal stress UspA family protein
VGNAAKAIVDQADDPGAMIVMATHGRSGLQRMLIGSVADVVVRTATVPVALIRGVVEAGAIPESFRHILVPLDGSDRSATALPLAIELARGSGAHLHLLQVVLPVPVSEIGYATDTSFLDPDVYADMMVDLERSADDDLESARHTCERAGVRATTHVLVGTPSDGILRVAEDVAADLIVMASRGRGGARRMVLGSVTTGLVQRSGLPLIVVPARVQMSNETGDQTDMEIIKKASSTK